MTKIYFLSFISLLISFFLTACAGTSGPQRFASTPTYNMIVSHKGSLEAPLGGSYPKGIKILTLSNPVKDAEAVYSKQGATMIRFSSWAELQGAAGRPYEEILPGKTTAKVIVIPGTGIRAPDKSIDYQRAANDYAELFNRRMQSLMR